MYYKYKWPHAPQIINQTLQAPTSVSELTYHAGQVIYDFNLHDIISGLPEISYSIYARMSCIIISHGFNDCKTIFF